MKKTIVTLTTILITTLLIIFQIQILNKLPLYSVISNIGIVFVIMLSVKSNENIGGAIGILFGALLDTFYGLSLGKNILLYFLVGYGSGKIKRKISIDNNISIVILTITVTVIFELANLLFVFLEFRNASFELSYIVKVLILESIYNIFLTYVFYIPFSSWGEVLNRTRKGYYI